MITLISICDLFWLLWLLPLLLGALLTWLYWKNKYSSMVDEYEGKIKSLHSRINGLEGDLADCGSRRADLEGDLAITKGRIREIESEMTALQAAADEAAKNVSSGANLGNVASAMTGAVAGAGLGSDNDNTTISADDSINADTGRIVGKYNVPLDNLQVIEGIGPKMEEVLKNNGINTHSDLANHSAEEIQAILDKYGDKYKLMNPETWSQQAGLAAAGEYDELIELQKKLDAGNTDAVGYTDAKLEKYLIKTKQIEDPNANKGGGSVASFAAGSNASAASNTSSDESASGKSGASSKFSGIKSDNLQIIEGIGPKMESVLKENGVNNHSDLSSKSPDDLRAILAKYGDKYKLIDPTTWGQQAGYAKRQDYEGLIDLQKKLDTGKDNAAGMTDSKLEKYLIKTGAIKAFKQDDLKAIEGIGPATEKLLHENGIKTWRELANTEAAAIKAILDAAGARFKLSDPTTWPKQAEMAADGKFDELREYQDYLDGGKG